MPVIHKAKRDDNPNTQIRKAPPTEYVRYLLEKYAYWIIITAIAGYLIYRYWFV